MTHTTPVVPYRRKRQGKTDYPKRLRLLLGNTPRLIIRRTGHNITAQIATFTEAGDRIICSAHSRELIHHGWTGSRKNLPAAYLTGLLLAAKANKARITNAVLDIGLFRAVKGSRLFATLAGAIDGGLCVPHAKDCLPPPARLSGAHIASYGELLRNAKQAPGHQFTQTKPLTIPDSFTHLKSKLLPQHA